MSPVPVRFRRPPGAPPDRATGRTTRTLWRALLAASEGNEQTRVVVVVRDLGLADWTFTRLLDLAERVQFEAHHAAREVVLPNGSTIRVMPAARLEDRLRGFTGQVLKDHTA